jgi:hypothetical protein
MNRAAIWSSTPQLYADLPSVPAAIVALPVGNWTATERCEMMRAYERLLRDVSSAQWAEGLSDQGEPWFAIYDDDTAATIIHFARIGEAYVASTPCGACHLVTERLANAVCGFLDYWSCPDS